MKGKGGQLSEKEWREVAGENERKQQMCEWNEEEDGEDVAAHCENASGRSVGVWAVSQKMLTWN